jgi:hypothetical protein
MNQDQLDSLVRTALKMIGGILIAHGAQQAATAINTPDAVEFVAGLVAAGISVYASHKSNAPASNPTPPTQPCTPKQNP